MKKDKVALTINGLNLMQFFSRVKRQSIKLFNLVKHNYKTLSFVMFFDDYKKLENYLNNFFVIEKMEFLGEKKFVEFIKLNLGYLIGIFIVLLMSIFSTTIVWQVEVFGNTTTQASEVISFLATQNVKVGKIFNADIDNLERLIMQNIPTVADASIEKKGTTILVNISEKLFFTESEYDPIVSNFNGIIKEIKLYSGFSTIKVNDFIRKGDILVQPYIFDNSGNKVKIKPVADITVQAQVVGVATKKIDEKLVKYTGKKQTKTYFSLFGLELMKDKFNKKFEFYDKVVYTDYIAKNMILPIVRHTEIYREIIFEEKHNVLEDCKTSLLSDSEKIAMSQINNNQIISKDIIISEIAGYYVCTTNLQIDIIIN